MAPASRGFPAASTLSVVEVVNAVVGVGGELKVTASGTVITFAAKVTKPCESALPLRDAPAPTVMAPAAMTVPENDDEAPVLTAPVTCQNTFEAWAPLTNLMSLEAAVLRAALTWKMKTAFGSFSPSRVIVPVRVNAAAVA